VTKAGELPWIPATNGGPSDPLASGKRHAGWSFSCSDPLASPALLIGKTPEKDVNNVLWETAVKLAIAIEDGCEPERYKLRPDRKAPGSATFATRAVASNGPTPGM